ncbi:MAG: hypothetical protein CL792_00730 [Chloroflexi bacterium]|nr:hypothetical protein [Chloroflexota bacterium]|tara:strand:+ start:2862 stop:5612 length:2751 start_codon:yes stop_codon:yes gene_type:complete
MKPLRLEVQGFTVFREKTSVDFEGRTLFAITGSIGAGKSSLLDAMMWALYGNVPRVGASTSQLKSNGVKSMHVLFEFQARGKNFRVVRKHPSDNSNRLEIQEGEGKWNLIADRSRDVTDKIVDLLGMDFSTFTRTVILPQGQFDAFLKSDIKARRDILVKLLGLSMYEKARSIANKRADDAHNTARTIEDQLEQLKLSSPDDIQKFKDQLKKTNQILDGLTKRKETLHTLGTTFTDTREKESLLKTLNQNYEDSKKGYKETQDSLESTLKNIEEFENSLEFVIQTRKDLEYNPDIHNELKVQLKIVVKREQLKKLNDKQREIKKNISETEDALREHQKNIVFKQKDLLKKSSSLDLIDINDPIEDIYQLLQEKQREIEKQKNQLTEYFLEEKKLSEEIAIHKKNVKNVQLEHNRILAKQKNIEEKLIKKQTEYANAQKENVIADLLSGLKSGDLCPVCGQEMFTMQDNPVEGLLHDLHEALEKTYADSEKLNEVFSKSISVLSVAENQVKITTDNLQIVRRKMGAIEEHLVNLGTSTNEIDGMITLLEELITNVEEISKLEKECRDLENELDQFNGLLSADTGFSIVEEQLNDLLQQINEVNSETANITESGIKKAIEDYDQLFDKYEEMNKKIESYKSKINDHKIEADTQKAGVVRHEKIVQNAEEAVNEVEQILKKLNADLKQKWNVTIEKDGEPDFEKLRRIMEAHQNEENENNALVGSLEAQLLQAQNERKSAVRMRQEIKDKRKTGELHKSLATELQSSRFIEFVQTEAMNSLATDTSSWLDRFTNGRYELIAESGDFSVVDRLNGDEKRSVKTLSGGESFLTSLALALSLSEHLPELSGLGGGMSLESLFLDEGFGTLDVESLDLAVQGLETLAGGSRLVGVISHVGELGERIPDRIEVIKNGNLSYIAE